MREPAEAPTLRDFALRTAVACAVFVLIVGSAVVLWWHPVAPLLAFLSVLGALLLDGASRPLRARLHVPRPLAVGLVVFLGFGLAIGAAWYWGPLLAKQAGEFSEDLPRALEDVANFLADAGVLKPSALEDENGMDTRIEALAGRAWKPVAGFLGSALSALSGGLVVVASAIFLALEPRPYVRGITALVKREARPRVREVLGNIDHALRWWLVGRLGSMGAVAVLTVAGLYALDAPYPLLLGLVAGLLSFVPYLGPILGAAPALLLGLAESPKLALWIALLYLGVQLIEGYAITPVIQRRAVSLPPAVLILSQVFLGLLFGLLGILLAAPLTVVAIVAVQSFYVADVLKERTHVLGDHGGEGESVGAG